MKTLTLRLGDTQFTMTHAQILSNVEVMRHTVYWLPQCAGYKTNMEMIEHGGWVFFNPTNGEFRCRHARGDKQSVGLLNNIPTVPGFVQVADFHCHPGKKVFACIPSPEDVQNSKLKSYFSFVITNTSEPAGGFDKEKSVVSKVESLVTRTSSTSDGATAAGSGYRIWGIDPGK
jgi:hypothetical protein